MLRLRNLARPGQSREGGERVNYADCQSSDVWHSVDGRSESPQKQLTPTAVMKRLRALLAFFERWHPVRTYRSRVPPPEPTPLYDGDTSYRTLEQMQKQLLARSAGQVLVEADARSASVV